MQGHTVSEDLGVVAGGERSGSSHARIERRESYSDVVEGARESVEASEHVVLGVEASAHVPGWGFGAASAAATRSANHAHCFAEAIVTRAPGSHRRHVRTKSH